MCALLTPELFVLNVKGAQSDQQFVTQPLFLCCGLISDLLASKNKLRDFAKTFSVLFWFHFERRRHETHVFHQTAERRQDTDVSSHTDSLPLSINQTGLLSVNIVHGLNLCICEEMKCT